MFSTALRSTLLMALTSVAIASFQIPKKQAIQAASFEVSDEVDIPQQVSQLRLLSNVSDAGFSNIASDFLFLQFLQYFGDSAERERMGYAASPYFFEAVLERDPNYRDFYLFLSGSSTIYAGKPAETVAIMDKALEKIEPNQPVDGYYIWRYKAVDELLFLGDSKAAQKSFSTSADWAQQSTDSNAHLVGEMSQKTAAFLANNPDSRAAQIDAWSSLLTTALDKTTREHAIEKIESLGGSVIFNEDGGIQVRHMKAEGPSDDINNSDI